MFNRTSFISRRTVEQVGVNSLSASTVLISINSPIDTPDYRATKLDENAWSKILRLEFHDADQSGYSIDHRVGLLEHNQRLLFNDAHAEQVLKFLRSTQLDHELVVVNCEGGISRSAAVAKFIAMIYRLEFPEGYMLYNRHVFSTLLKFFNRCLFGEGPINISELPGGMHHD